MRSGKHTHALNRKGKLHVTRTLRPKCAVLIEDRNTVRLWHEVAALRSGGARHETYECISRSTAPPGWERISIDDFTIRPHTAATCEVWTRCHKQCRDDTAPHARYECQPLR
jgi:hypothetical protein